VVAVIGAIAAGMASDELAARATLRRIYSRKTLAQATGESAVTRAEQGDQA